MIGISYLTYVGMVSRTLRYAEEEAAYMKKLAPYGVPLDNRHSYALLELPEIVYIALAFTES